MSILLFALNAFTPPAADAQPAFTDVTSSPIPIRILVQSPAETDAELQTICLFFSSPENTLHGSLLETNEKLTGLLDRIRKPELFRGDLGETLVIAPPAGSLQAKKLLIVGLGDSRTFSPERMQLVGEILYVEAARLGVTHPFFAPTILDGGVTGFNTGQVSEQVTLGFLRAAAMDRLLRDAHAAAVPRVSALTFLAGAKNADNTRLGIEKAVAASTGK